MEQPLIHSVPALPQPTQATFETDYGSHSAEKTPIVIDNGATDFRYGWATSKTPYASSNMVAKYRERKNNKLILLFGNAVEVEGASRLATKSTWEGDILSNPDALESAFDFAFLRLGIDSETIEHPIIMSERLATPISCRTITSELLFECYSAPSVMYSVDSILSHSYNRRESPQSARDALIISFNTASTSLIPVLGGTSLLSQAKRIPWGGSQASEFLTKLLGLKYPNFASKITSHQSNWILHNFCSFSPSYADMLKQLGTPAGMSAADVIVQFPYSQAHGEEKTEEQLAEIAERRKEAGRRLQEQAAKSRAEKLAQKEADLKHLLNVKEYKDKETQRDFNARLKKAGVDSEARLEEEIKRIEQSLKRARKKDEALDDDVPEEPSFPLVDVPDVELNEDQIKEKRKQRLAKAGYEARVRMRKEKEKEKLAKEEQEREEQREREADLGAWNARVRREHIAVVNRIKERRKRRAALKDRKTSAAQSRMRNIASLANDGKPTDRRRKKVDQGEDMFGEKDSDWNIYHAVNLDNASDEEEEDLVTLSVLESKLFTFDSTFSYSETLDGMSEKSSALMNAFRPRYEEGDTRGANRVHLNVERWRVPEAWWQPGMAGVDTAGLGELVENVLKRFKEEERQRMVKDVFLTGGPSLLPGLADRLRNTLTPIMAPETPINIHLASDPRLDAWHGMAQFALSNEMPKVSVSKAEYQEWGGERIKRWWGGNWNLALSPSTNE